MDNPYDSRALFDSIPPTAVLRVTPEYGYMNNTTYTVDASASFESDKPQAQLFYGWDRDNDGKVDGERAGEDAYRYEPQIEIYYRDAGMKTVQVMVKGGHGLIDTALIQIEVRSQPIANFHWKVLDNQYLLNGSASSNGVPKYPEFEYRWDLDSDGEYDTDYSSDPLQLIPRQPGVIPRVTLSIRDEAGYTSTVTHNITEVNMEGARLIYPLNGDAVDQSQSLIHGELNGAHPTIDRWNQAEQAIWFDGIDDYILVGNHSELDATASYSLSFWANFENSSGGLLSSDWTAAAYAHGFGIRYDYNMITAYQGEDNFGGQWYPFAHDQENIQGFWYHFVVVMGPNSTFTIYRNGVDDTGIRSGHDQSFPVPHSDAPFVLGKFSDLYFSGKLDDFVYFVDRILTEDEIWALAHTMF
jgi:hypothetical protein